MITFEIYEMVTREGYRYKIYSHHLNFRKMQYENLTPRGVIDTMQEITNIMNNDYDEECSFVIS